MFDRRIDSAGRAYGFILLLQLGMLLLELSYLANRSPANVAVTGVSEIGIAAGLIVEREIKLRCQFVSDSLILNEAVFSSGADRLFVQVDRVEVASFDARNFSHDQAVFV